MKAEESLCFVVQGAVDMATYMYSEEEAKERAVKDPLNNLNPQVSTMQVVTSVVSFERGETGLCFFFFLTWYSRLERLRR